MSIVVEGTLVPGEYAGVLIEGRDRIAAVRRAADLHLAPGDPVVEALDQAMQADAGIVELEVRDGTDARVLSAVLETMSNGDDGSGRRAAARLARLPTSRSCCPRCGGTGEVVA